MTTRKKFLGFFLAALTLVGCSKDDKSEAIISSDEAVINARLDTMNDDLSSIINSQLTTDDGITGKDSNGVTDFLPACATVTRVPAFGTIITPGTTITKTVDFGTVGCALNNGNILKGVIIITFTYQPTATSHTVNYQFVNFYHNAVKIEGNKTFTRTMSTATATNPSHPIITMNMDLVATFPNGNVHNRIGSRTAEIIEGYNTVILSDNVYSVTGSWTTSFPNASLITSTITSPLIVKLNCNNITQGIITLVRDNNSATLDYGNGICDNQAVFTINGNSYQITLGN
jgi:hypothetical protein